MLDILTVILIVYVCRRIYRWFTHACVEPEEYLEVLDPQEWKELNQIKVEMEELKDGWLDEMEVYSALQQLVRRDIAERKVVDPEPESEEPPTLQYRSKSNWQPRRRAQSEKLKTKFNLGLAPAC